MQILKILPLAAVTLAGLVGVTSARAVTETYIYMTPPSAATPYFTFDSLSPDIGGITPTHTKGEQFTDNFIFSTADAFDVISSIATADVDPPFLASEVNFTSVSLVPTDSTGAILGPAYSFAGVNLFEDSFRAYGATAPAGQYELSVSGTFLVDGADYSGFLVTTPVTSPVPETAPWILTLAGLGALTALLRRSKSQEVSSSDIER